MAGNRTFSDYHPVVILCYFVAVLAFAMTLMHPFCLGVSLLCALANSVHLKGVRQTGRSLKWLVPMMLLAALMNPLFNHRGGTILAYLPSDNPLTLESMVYGVAAGLMLAAVIGWFGCLNEVMTSDKLVYLFGRAAPALALLLSMALGLVPRFRAQLKVIRDAQQASGRDVASGRNAACPAKKPRRGLWRRARQGIRVLSIMITWALENAIDTADSMKARGYGLPGRTAFSIYRFTRRDGLALAFIGAAAGYLLAGALTGGLYFRYFPTIKGQLGGAYMVSLLAVYLALGALPIILNVKEELTWKHIMHQAGRPSTSNRSASPTPTGPNRPSGTSA